MQKSNKTNLFPMAATAIFAAISIALSGLVFYIPLLGFPSVRFSVTGIPIFLAGSLFGGAYGAIAGFLSDIIGFMFSSGGAPYHPGFTINSILVGLIPGIIFSQIRKKGITASFNRINFILGLVAAVGAIVYINFIGIHEIEELGSFMGTPTNIVLSVIMVVIFITLVGLTMYVQNKFTDGDSVYSIDKIIFVKILNYIVVQLICTPIWLSQLYNIPVVASVMVRVFKTLIDIPLQVMLVYLIIKVIPVNLRNKYLV
ncbi:folate family ECF transporter S component [Cellulosilyticum ruminicola]|uniref:folate family ECF transporter S component n=1 Tax=Cellulosilyticum ruminicola TaxID=425254 RepID=UPI0006CFE34D|nr:folate family ECF transporter S component [Cellulosilyticum ruminicola]